MIVYGDPSSQEPFGTLVERLKESLSAVRRDSLDDARAVLIQAGMLEQAVEDFGDGTLAAPCRALTDVLAEGFVDRFRSEDGRGFRRLEASSILGALPDDGPLLTVKMPEGFAFYALYPEAYVLAAERWLNSPSPEWLVSGEGAGGWGPKVLVIGVRSIGTTLAAVVLAALRGKGVDARRITLRPWGHPFAREARLDPEVLGDATHVLIVDEGPGLSGSSMAACAEAVHRAGLSREAIAFLPGHGNDPGGMASEEIRRWWRETPRYVVRTEEIRWKGRSLEETLARDGRIEELTGGRWREFVYKSPAQWPAVAFPFERRKLLVTRADGSRTLYKFVGITPSPSGSSWRGGRGERLLGFAPAPWIDGEPLTRADATPELLARIARHIAAVAGPPLPPSEAEGARGRLAHLLEHNAQEAGLSPLPLPPLQDKPLGEGVLAAGDYRLAPHEWRRLEDGSIVKTNARPASGDHTVVGRQPIAWDVAGAMVEWNLDERTAAPLLDALAGEGVETTPEERRFYRAAYAAFQMGLHAHCVPFAPESERKRLEAAAARYRETTFVSVAG